MPTFHKDSMSFTGVYRHRYNNIEVFLDEDLVPVVFKHTKISLKAGTEVSLQIVENGYIISSAEFGPFVIADSGSDGSTYYLTRGLEKYLFNREEVTDPFDPDDWEEDFTQLALDAIKEESNDE